jgi:dihydrofolate synthase/folylpolyglutamate synthase
VDIDHTDYLGDTREKIAFEKAGIFRQGRVAICAEPEPPQSLVDHASNIGAELWLIGHDFGPVYPLPHTGEGQGTGQWNFRSPFGTRNALPYPALRGAFQLHNASAVLAVLDVLKSRLPVSMEAVRRGLVEVQLSGRFQFVPGRPTIILDVAHNPHAARTLAQNLGALPPCPHRYAVFAMLKDKDMAGVAAALDPYIDTWLVAGISAPRGATAGELEQVLQDVGVRGVVQTFQNVGAALRHACNIAGENDRIAAFGSFYTVAEAMVATRNKY